MELKRLARSRQILRRNIPRFGARLGMTVVIALTVLPGLHGSSFIAIRTSNSGLSFSGLAAGTEDRGVQELRALVASASGRPAEQDLAKIESKYSGSRSAALAQFLRGYLHFNGQDYAGAVSALDAAKIAANSSLGDYALYYRAQSEAAAGQGAGALRDYQAVDSKYADSLMAREAKIGAIRSELALGDNASVLRDAAALVQAKDPDGLLLTAQALEQTGKQTEALALYRKVYFFHPASAASGTAAERLQALNASPAANPGTAEEERARADGLFESRQYSEALAAYNDLIARFPDAASNDDLLLKRGVSLLDSRDAAEAAAALLKVTERNPNVHAEALYYRAEAQRRAGLVGDSAATVERLISQHRGTHWAQTAIYNLATYLGKKGRVDEAAAKYAQIMSLYPGTENAAEASYNVGKRAYAEGRYSEAAHTLEQHLAEYRYPTSKFLGESGLCAAKSEEKIGNKRRALAIYDYVAERYHYGYDGLVASRRASYLRSASSALQPEEALAGSDLEKIKQNLTAVQPIVETANGSEASRVARADDLEVVGLSDQAISEMNQALLSAPASPKLNLRLARIYSGRGDTLQATLVLRKAYPDLFSYKDSDLPREAWEIFFPLRYWNTIKEEAGRYGIDPYFAAGLIRQESVFNPNAISHAGARGLMQLMTPTAQLIAKHEGGGRLTSADLYSPQVNIKLGMNYLAQMVGEFGQPEYAAAAYNAGPGRAKQWAAARGSKDMEDWIESIPFSETRAYVQGVLRNEANYRRLYR
ncbi:MAG TPA: transglycosylase SLT domain-containing protein [Blastocatellia bacterium]|nr:transglycosylase SLT domain-containing protein [Blastocatellia bacterium]